jgi:hypothetical protein
MKLYPLVSDLPALGVALPRAGRLVVGHGLASCLRRIMESSAEGCPVPFLQGGRVVLARQSRAEQAHPAGGGKRQASGDCITAADATNVGRAIQYYIRSYGFHPVAVVV